MEDGTIAGVRSRPTLFTLRNARLHVGAYGSIYTNSDIDLEEEGFLKQSVGSFPAGYEYTPGEGDTLQYLATGLLLDYASPNSVLGIAFGAEYNENRFGIRNTTADTITSSRIRSIRFPAYLKIKVGSVHSRVNGIVMPGVQYNLPLSYQRRSRNGVLSRAKDEAEAGLYLSLILGLQYRILKNDGNDGKRSIYWIFARGDMATGNVLSIDGSRAVFGQDGSTASVRDLNVSIGIAFFLGTG